MYAVTSHDCDDFENFHVIGPFGTYEAAQNFVDDALSRETSNEFRVVDFQTPDVTAYGDKVEEDD